MCFPDFDSPTVFGRLLSCDLGGHFSITPIGKCDSNLMTKQFYLPSSNVLVTRFNSDCGIGQITDLMPIKSLRNSVRIEDMQASSCIVRKMEAVRGEILVRVECKPAFDYGRRSHQTEVDGSRVLFNCPGFLNLELECISMGQGTSVEWQIEKCKEYKIGESTVISSLAVAEITIAEGSELILVLHKQDEAVVAGPKFDNASAMITQTIDYWHFWIKQCTYKGRWREIVHRSALVLKLLTYSPTGAIIASPTTSLPEDAWVAGVVERNWDYRFTWIRDAAFTVYAFLRIGFKEEARAFMRWIEDRCNDLKRIGDNGLLKILYDIRGGHPTITSMPLNGLTTQYDEITLDHWEGYHGRGPVRIGNSAAHQVQSDIYGELMDSIYLSDKYVEPVSWDFWTDIREMLVEPVIRGWRAPDHGIWEIRGAPRNYVHSRLMSWVALDRAIRLAGKRSLPCDLLEWRTVRDEIKCDIMENGWSNELQSFVQSYGSDRIDASNLMMPLVFFLSPSDPRLIKTLELAMKKPADGGLRVNNLVFRFTSPTNPAVEEGTFTMCSFWLVEALARAGQQEPKYLCEAQRMFEDILGYANHLGLFSEEIDLSGRALGNFPQAFTHLSLISSAFNLDRFLDL